MLNRAFLLLLSSSFYLELEIQKEDLKRDFVSFFFWNDLMTYFFAEGHIYVILNKLAQLSTKDYNSEGTACNQETLRNFWFYKIKIVQSFEAVHIWHKFIVCMKTLIAIFGLMVCLCFPFHSASTKKVALSRNIQNQVLKPFLYRATFHSTVLLWEQLG